MSKEEVLAIIGEHEATKAFSPGYPEENAAMAKAKKAGIMDGTRPDSPLTRGELAIILDRMGELN